MREFHCGGFGRLFGLGVDALGMGFGTAGDEPVVLRTGRGVSKLLLLLIAP